MPYLKYFSDSSLEKWERKNPFSKHIYNLFNASMSYKVKQWQIEIFYFVIFITNRPFWTPKFSKTAKIKRIFNYSGGWVSYMLFSFVSPPQIIFKFKIFPKIRESLQFWVKICIWKNWPKFGSITLILGYFSFSKHVLYKYIKNKYQLHKSKSLGGF